MARRVLCGLLGAAVAIVAMIALPGCGRRATTDGGTSADGGTADDADGAADGGTADGAADGGTADGAADGGTADDADGAADGGTADDADGAADGGTADDADGAADGGTADDADGAADGGTADDADGAADDGTADDAADGDTGPEGPAWGIVATTSGPEAIAAGIAVLEEGGSATDAALTVAMAQIVLSMGSWNSFAGILGLLHHDGETGEIASLHGNFGTFAGETDPLTIPADEPSGRTAMVGGFMAAAEAAWVAHGRLPWSRLIEPAIALAEDGVVLDSYLAWFIASHEAVLRRREDTWAIFSDADGNPLRQGDLLVQQALADTLRHVADEGAGYMYTGAWAERFVAAVGEEGGAATLEDLAGYTADWMPTIETEYAGTTIYTMGDRELGGVQIVEALNMAVATDLAGMGPWWESGEALYWVERITQVNQLLTWFQDYYPSYGSYVMDNLPGVVLEDASRVDPAQAALLVGYVQDGTWQALVDLLGYDGAGKANHSDAIAVWDGRGDAVALTHSINTIMWGGTGIFVDGVSIPDAASFQQDLLAQIPPGDPLPTPLNPCLALRDGQLVLAGSTVGNVHYAQLQRLAAVLGLGLYPEDAVQTPMLSGWGFSEVVERGAFSDEVLAEAAARGASIEVTRDENPPAWVGLSLGEDGQVHGGVEAWLVPLGAAVGATATR